MPIIIGLIIGISLIFSDQRFIGTPYFFKKLKTYISEITLQTGDSIGESLKDFVVLARKKDGDIYARYAVGLLYKILSQCPFFHILKIDL